MDNLLVITGVFLLVLFSGIPVVYGMILTAATYFFILNDNIPATLIAQRSIGQLSESFTLLAVPLFLLAGNLLNASDMTRRLVAFAVALVGHIRGGLGHAVVVANVVMSGMSGSATSDAAGIGAIMIPSLKKAGFKPAYAAALPASAATLGPIIPPSIAMVLYASLANVSLGRLLLAGFIPGVVMALFLMADIYFSRASAGVATVPFDWRTLRSTAKDAILCLIMPAIILGGMFGGVYTPTEGAAAAVFYVLAIGLFVYRSLTPASIFQALKESARMTGGVLIIVAAASTVSWVMVVEQAGAVLKNLFVPLQGNPSVTLLSIATMTLILGTAMEETTMLVLMTPILVPIAMQAGIDPVHFGLVFVFATMLGLITPPVGITMFITCRIADVTVNQFTRAVIRPFLALVFALVVCVLWPDLVLFLPRAVMGH